MSRWPDKTCFLYRRHNISGTPPECPFKFCTKINLDSILWFKGQGGPGKLFYVLLIFGLCDMEGLKVHWVAETLPQGDNSNLHENRTQHYFLLFAWHLLKTVPRCFRTLKIILMFHSRLGKNKCVKRHSWLRSSHGLSSTHSCSRTQEKICI